jgi:hypothetical protein
MLRIHLGDQQRDVGVHAVIARVRDHRAAAVRVVVFRFARDRGVEAGEEETRLEAGAEGLHGQAADVVRDEGLQPPVRRRAVRLPGAPVRCDDLMHAEPGMVREQLDEALAHGAGRAEDGDGDAFRACR